MCVNENKKVFMDFLCAKRKYFYLCAVINKSQRQTQYTQQ